LIKNGYKISKNFYYWFADGILVRSLTPSVTTVSQHAPEIERAAQLLLIDWKTRRRRVAPLKRLLLIQSLKEDQQEVKFASR
jgi:LacI family transcriptional regulator